MTQRALILVLLSLGLLVAGLAARNADVALLALPFLVYLGAGILETPTVEDVHLKAERSVEMISSNGNGSSSGAGLFRVHLSIRNEGGDLLSLRLAEPMQPGMSVTGGDLEQGEDPLRTRAALAPGEVIEAGYTVEAQRGTYRWRTLPAVVSDPFELFESQMALPAAAGVEIQPRLSGFGSIPLPPGRTLHSPGTLPGRIAGSGTDFWGVREYQSGDPLRRLDWRLAARHPGQLFTREFEQEEIADVGLIVDAREKTEVRIGGDSLFEHTVSATASLAEALLHAGHRVGLVVLGDRIATVFPGYSKAQLHRILHCLANVRPGPTNPRVSLGYLPLDMFSTRALLIVFSPLAPGDRTLFPRLRARGNGGLLICPDAITFAARGNGDDQVGRMAVRLAGAERRLELREIARSHFRVIDWRVDRPLSPLIREAFRPTRGSRLSS